MIQFITLVLIVVLIVLFLTHPIATMLCTLIIAILAFGVAWVIAQNGKNTNGK